MNRILTLGAALTALTCTKADAARLIVEPLGLAGNGAYALYLDGEEHNGNFNAISVTITPNAPAMFANPDPDGVDGTSPRPPGDQATFYNSLFHCLGFGCDSWSVLGAEVTEEKLEFVAGPLGRTIDTSIFADNRRFLANVWLPEGTATANVQIIGAGELLQELSTPIPAVIPEPATLLLLGVACFGFSILRRSDRNRP